MPEFPDTPIFENGEQENFRNHPHLRPYAGITKAQFAGLLSALGEYAIRVGEDAPLAAGADLNDPELAEAHRALVNFYWGQRGARDATDRHVFDAKERNDLSFFKYVRGNENVRKREAVRLLDALGRYSRNAPKLK